MEFRLAANKNFSQKDTIKYQMHLNSAWIQLWCSLYTLFELLRLDAHVDGRLTVWPCIFGYVMNILKVSYCAHSTNTQ